MGAIPREAFVPDASRRDAYADGALPIESGQTISQPLMVAKMTERLEVEPGNRILEIGTETGYQAADDLPPGWAPTSPGSSARRR